MDRGAAAFNPNQDVLGDTISALGFAVCFYYGFTGLACAVYFRRDLFKSARNFFLAGLVPVLGGIMMAYVGDQGVRYYNTAGNNYSKPILGIRTPIFVGIGGLILGVILMFASWPFFPQFFSRKWWGAADPAVLEADAQHGKVVLTPNEPPESHPDQRDSPRVPVAGGGAPAQTPARSATRSRCQRASPNACAFAFARFRKKCRSCSQVKPIPPWTCNADAATRKPASPAYAFAIDAARGAASGSWSSAQPAQ